MGVRIDEARNGNRAAAILDRHAGIRFEAADPVNPAIANPHVAVRAPVGPDVAEQQIGHSHLPQLWIEHIAQPVAQNVDHDNEQAELDYWEEDDPPRAREQELVADADQRAQ